MNTSEKLIRSKLFLKFNRISPSDLARRIEEMTGVPTGRSQIHAVIKGTMKDQRIRQGIAEILGEPVEHLWNTGYIKFGSGRKSKAA